MKITEKEVFLEVVDYGLGFIEKDIKEKKSLGMITMRERAELIGGRITIVSEKKRTSIKVIVPLECDVKMRGTCEDKSIIS